MPESNDELLELIRQLAAAAGNDALAGCVQVLDERLTAGGDFPRSWTHEDEVISVLPDGKPGTTRTRPLRVPAALRIPEGGKH